MVASSALHAHTFISEQNAVGLLSVSPVVLHVASSALRTRDLRTLCVGSR